MAAPACRVGRRRRFARLSGGVLDVDAQMRAEEALGSREQHLRSILETVPDAMIVIDAVGTIQLFSRAAERMFGITQDQAIGQNVRVLMPEPDRGRQIPISNVTATRASRGSSASAAFFQDLYL